MSTSTVPIFQSFNTSHLPPTPTCSSLNKVPARELSSVQIPTSQYGSLNTTAPYFESLSNSRPVTPSQTTISTNNNDESLYLLWTQELLRERGFTSTTEDYTQKNEEGNSDEDEDDSSVSDISSVSSEEDKISVDHCISEQRRIFSPMPSSLHAYSHRASMVSRYSSTSNYATEEPTAEISIASQNPISIFFHNCFSSCL